MATLESKRVAKREKNRAEVEMTKRQHHKGLQVRRCEDPLRCGELESLKSKASGSPLRSHLCRREARFPFHYGNSKKTLAFGPLISPSLEV